MAVGRIEQGTVHVAAASEFREVAQVFEAGLMSLEAFGTAFASLAQEIADKQFNRLKDFEKKGLLTVGKKGA